jgi:hypothetical protein
MVAVSPWLDDDDVTICKIWHMVGELFFHKTLLLLLLVDDERVINKLSTHVN